MIRKLVKNLLPHGIARAKQREHLKETHINRALWRTRGFTYVEIGVFNGACFRQIRADRKIAVDPEPRGSYWESLADGELLYQATSDVFFRDVVENALGGRRIDVALVDGLHEFKQALNDVLNLERHMSSHGVVFLHDCNPPTREHAENGVGTAWNGDVWKVAYFLANSRPDLRFFTLDCDWGLGVLTGFQPSSFPSEPPSSDVVDNYKSLDYSFLARDRRRTLRLHHWSYSWLYFNLLHPRYKR